MTTSGAARYRSVLDDGLPALPARITPGRPVPVAVWSGSRFGAVTVVEDCEHDSGCPNDEHYVAMTYTYRRGLDGWEPSNGAGGTDWPGGTSTNATLAAREVLLEDGSSGFSKGWTCWKVEGFAGTAARWVELREGSEITRRAIAASGAFVVVCDGEDPGMVRILDHDEDVLETYDFGTADTSSEPLLNRIPPLDFTAMFPLPLRPSFRVFGLSDAFDGFRWLESWQRPSGPRDGDITDVSLGHGHPHDGPFVLVETVLKQAGRDLGRGASIGSIGVEHVALTVVMNAVEIAAPSRHRARAMIEHEFAQIRETNGEVVLNGWRARDVSIDGIARPSHCRDLGGSRAIVVELPTLVIGIWGHVESTDDPWDLADVSGSLGEYVAGKNESADTLLS